MVGKSIFSPDANIIFNPALIRRIFAFGTIFTASKLVLPLSLLLIYDSFVPSNKVNGLTLIVLTVLAFFLVDASLRIQRAHVIGNTNAMITWELSRNAFAKVISLPFGLLRTPTTEEQVGSMQRFEETRSLSLDSVTQSLTNLPLSIILCFGLIFIDPILAAIHLVLILILAALAIFSYKTILRLNGEQKDYQAHAKQLVLESVDLREQIRNLGIQNAIIERLRDSYDEGYDAAARKEAFSMALTSLQRAIASFAPVAIILYAGSKTAHGDMSIGVFIALFGVSSVILGPWGHAHSFIEKVNEYSKISTAFNRLHNISSEHEQNNPALPKRLTGRVLLDRISHRFDTSAQPILAGCSLQTKPGSIVCIKGDSGSGKSTLLRLIAGQIRPSTGRLIYDGFDCLQIPPHALRARIGYVSQSPQYFYGTILENLRMRKSDATDEEVFDALRLAALTDDIDALPNGLQTWLRDSNETTMSAGFVRRFALARAFLGRPGLIILDEPGKDIDAEADATILNSLRTLMATSTIIFTSQRPSHWRAADQVYELSQGRLEPASTI
ncbi:MAG: ATP-binding cassette domain-containing protein [Geminicoccaceae bacterium]